MSEPSEFGAGVVVCLAKFSEHLQDRREPSPEGKLSDYTQKMQEHFKNDSRLSQTDAQAYSSEVEMWASGASDHFYELDEDRAPEPLKELAALTLEMGHSFTGKVWAMEDMNKVRELWKQSCLAVDEMLGTKPDWGQW